jgi:hypothetical protein
MQSVMLVFWTQLCELLPLYPSLWFTSPHPSPLPKVKVQYIESVWLGGGGGGLEFCWRPYSPGVLHFVSDQIQKLQNCFTTPNKNLGGARVSDRQTPAAKSLYRSTFLDKDIWHCFLSIWFSYAPPPPKQDKKVQLPVLSHISPVSFSLLASNWLCNLSIL